MSNEFIAMMLLFGIVFIAVCLMVLNMVQNYRANKRIEELRR